MVGMTAVTGLMKMPAPSPRSPVLLIPYALFVDREPRVVSAQIAHKHSTVLSAFRILLHVAYTGLLRPDVKMFREQ
uniref:Uncharacterized protein n=1 Tax=Romanomermis culicivorax TaxID=13658 RepID=A0A915KUE3_ROMCU